MIEINRWLSIPESELRFSAARSSGPGGQHVNKVSTRVILEFDVEGSPTLSSSQRQRIRDRMGARLGRDGRLRLSCQRHRSQAANRREVVERFANLLREALKPRRRRLETKVPAAERRRRLEQKKQRGRVKQERRTPSTREE
jgi:ribosome-associated protein